MYPSKILSETSTTLSILSFFGSLLLKSNVKSHPADGAREQGCFFKDQVEVCHYFIT